MQTRVATVIAALVFVPAASAVPLPIVTTGFQTPSGNIVCNAGPSGAGATKGRPVVVCTVLSEETMARGQKVWALLPTGRAAVGWVMGNAATDMPRLGYGRTWRWRGVVCRSRVAGLTCSNGSGHGFFLSRERQRVF